MTPASAEPGKAPASGTTATPIAGLPGKGKIEETVIYEGGPAKGDLIFGLVLAITLVGIPLAVGAIVRALWLRYRITSRRIEVNGGWLGRDRSQVVYSQIREVRSVPRGFGAWGDMVLVLNDGSKLEMRSVPRFREIEATIEELRQARTSKGVSKSTSGFAKPEAPAA
ncbi:MAG: PH domain-containing protein [Synechococcaceae cyanobacterium ELA263]